MNLTKYQNKYMVHELQVPPINMSPLTKFSSPLESTKRRVIRSAEIKARLH